MGNDRDGTKRAPATISYTRAAYLHLGEYAAVILDDRDSIWRSGNYVRNSLVTHGGALWLATADTDTKPGGEPGWQLIVKSPR